MTEFKLGDHVMKIGEDSRFEGHVVAVFYKCDGKTLRYVVENEDGVLHIANPKQLKWMPGVLEFNSGFDPGGPNRPR
jgi:hypothetical protein